MITAVDTNVLIDVFKADEEFGRRSADVLRQCLAEGVVVACEVVWIETAAIFDVEIDFVQAMDTLPIAYATIERDAALAAARAWRRYHARGGRRKRVAADFLIGAHAQKQADQLLTRDRGFYRDYFERLRVLDPSV